MRYQRAPVSDVWLDYHHVVYPFNARDEFRGGAATPPNIGPGDRGAACDLQLGRRCRRL